MHYDLQAPDGTRSDADRVDLVTLNFDLPQKNIYSLPQCYGWGTTSEYRFKVGDFARMGGGRL